MTDDILDFSKELDVSLLDNVVYTFFNGSGVEQHKAQQILTQFQEHESAWTRVDAILEHSALQQTKFIALQILEKFVQTRWHTLPFDSRKVIRDFIANVIVNISSNDASLVAEKLYINKLNIVLVQILKQDWPHNWPAFIPEIIQVSKTNPTFCENSMKILKLLSEEIFDFSEDQMTRKKIIDLKKQMYGELAEIYQLCISVLDREEKQNLITATLETLLRFISWVPSGYIFDTNLIETLSAKLFVIPAFRDPTLRCLTEICSLDIHESSLYKVSNIFRNVMLHANTIISQPSVVSKVYDTSNDDDRRFIQNFALFLTTFLKSHSKFIEIEPGNHELVLTAHQYLVEISHIDDREVFKVCLEYWAVLVQNLFEEARQMQASSSSTSLLSLSPAHQVLVTRATLYNRTLSCLREVMIGRMVKPEEVLIVENEEGEIVRQFVQESDTVSLYKSMREVLVYLTHLDVSETEHMMTYKLGKQMDGSEWSWSNLNKLCWAIGSISGAMVEETEKYFLIIVIQELLTLTSQKRGKDNKAVVASNIMYIVGQYPRFLKAHWRFLKTVIIKLFDFMHEEHPGVQDMACDTFIKISRKCKRQFVIHQVGERQPYIEDILETLQDVTVDLNSQQTSTVYQALGFIIAEQPQEMTQKRLIQKLMLHSNEKLKCLCQPDGISFDDANNVKLLVHILRLNDVVCSSIGPGFAIQLQHISHRLLEIYNWSNMAILQGFDLLGDKAVVAPKVRALLAVRREIIKIIEKYISHANQTETFDEDQTIRTLVLQSISDYRSGPWQVRDPVIPDLITTIVTKKEFMRDCIPNILDTVLQPTLDLISHDFVQFPELRVSFYNMLLVMNDVCFSELFQTSESTKILVDCVVWGFQHTMRDVADTGLTICSRMIDHVNLCDPTFANAFYQSYFLNILQDIFSVLTDREHKSGFQGQVEILAKLIQLVSDDRIQVTMYNPSQSDSHPMTNREFLHGHIMMLLQNAFPHLQSSQVKAFVIVLFEYNHSLDRFKSEIRDFLIQLKEFAGETADLYLEEKEAELNAMKKAEMERALRVPGIVKPSDLPMDEDDDL